MQKILEDKIFNVDVNLKLKDVLGCAKKEFVDLFKDSIKKKKTPLPESQNIEFVDNTVEPETDCKTVEAFSSDFSTTAKFSNRYWARATTKTKVTIEDTEEDILALVDHGSEVNILRKDVYDRLNVPIDRNVLWDIKGANNERGKVYGACPNVKVAIGDITEKVDFLVQENGGYPVILVQPYITRTIMETKVMDDGSHLARIKSEDGSKSVEFKTVNQFDKRHRRTLDTRDFLETAIIDQTENGGKKVVSGVKDVLFESGSIRYIPVEVMGKSLKKST